MKYVFANQEHTLVRCVEDNSVFELPRHVHPSNIAGHAAEQWRREGCPTPDPYRESEPVRTPDDADRRRRRGAADDRRRA
jgi:hypothetical protein